jgi:hypothetical protein
MRNSTQRHTANGSLDHQRQVDPVRGDGQGVCIRDHTFDIPGGSGDDLLPGGLQRPGVGDLAQGWLYVTGLASWLAT